MRVAHGRRGEGEHLVAIEFLGLAQRAEARTDQRVGPFQVEIAALVDVFGQSQHALAGQLRGRLRPTVGVDHQQVHGVRTDVEDPKAHERSLSTDRAQIGVRVDAVVAGADI